MALLAFGAVAFAAEPSSKSAPLPDGNWVTPFEAFALDGKTVLFRGEYAVERKAGLLREVQIYRDLEGKVVHRVESLYDEVNRKPVFYESDDFINNEAHIARILPSGVEYEQRDAQGKVTKSGRYKSAESPYLWPNLVQLVDANWENVVTGQDLAVDLFFTSLGTTVSVQVAAEGKSTVSGADGEQFKVVPNNGLFKLFVKPIRLVFSTDPNEPRRLLAFEGRSVVSGAGHKHLDLRIVFGARKSG